MTPIRNFGFRIFRERLQAHLGDLRGFTGAGFAGEDKNLVVAQRAEDLLARGGDRKVGWIGQAHQGVNSLSIEH